MATPPRTAQHGTFFVTTNTHDRRRLFQVDANALLFIDTLRRYRVEGHFKLFDFVVMPDHVHLILQPADVTLERAMQLIKGGFSRRLGSKMPAWQKGYTDHRIRDRADFDARRTYLRQNPVKAGLCEKAEAYRFSSAWTPAAKAAEVGGDNRQG